jgi:heat shock protein HslJ
MTGKSTRGAAVRRWIAILRIASGLAAGAATAAEPTAAAAPDALTGTSWRLLQFQSMDDAIGTLRPEDPSLYTLRLNSDGTVTMRLNCNRAMGSWSAEPSGDGSSGRFTFGPLAATRALCPPPSLDGQIASQAPYVRGYLLKDGRLYLSLMADGGIYAWESTGHAAPEDGGPRNWQVGDISGDLRLREQPSIRARVLAGYGAGTILDNLGCARTGERIWCDVQPLGGGPRGYVAAEFLQPAVGPDGSVATGPDDSALRAGQGQFDASGQLPCAGHAGQPLGACEFGVARAGGGYATVVVTHPDGRRRAIFFRMGVPVGADTSEADNTGPFSATRQADLQLIRVGNERYEIPDAVILGG